MEFNLPISRFRRKWFLQFGLNRANYLCFLFSKCQLRGAEAMWNSSDLKCERAMIHVTSTISPYGVLSDSFDNKCFLGLANLLLHFVI